MLTPGEKITDDHFRGTFIFPHDLDFIGETCKTDFFCSVFNDMIDERIKSRETAETSPQVKKSGKNAKIECDYHVEIYKKA